MYEHRTDKLLPRVQFVRRVIGHFGYSILACAIALGAGVLGYHVIAGLTWVDSLLNASMILGGMGPVDPLQTSGAKVFASFYALFSGLVFIGVLGLLLAPFIHRVMHKLHMDYKEDAD